MHISRYWRILDQLPRWWAVIDRKWSVISKLTTRNHRSSFEEISCKDWLRDGQCEWRQMFAMNGLLKMIPWIDNDTADGLVTIDLKLIPRNLLKTFNVVWLTVWPKDFLNPDTNVTKMSCSRVVYNFLKWSVTSGFIFSLFPHHLLKVPLYFWQAWGG